LFVCLFVVFSHIPSHVFSFLFVGISHFWFCDFVIWFHITVSFRSLFTLLWLCIEESILWNRTTSLQQLWQIHLSFGEVGEWN
jgi:hypothetical protein